MEIELGGPNDSETSLENINPTINQITESSETQSGVYRKVRVARTIEQAHEELGMSFDTTPNTSTEAGLTEPPLTKCCRQIEYEVVNSDEAGAIDNSHQDLFMANETRRFNTAELTPEIYEDIALVRKGLPPIGTAFFKAGVPTPTEIPQPESFQATPAILQPEIFQVPHDQI